MSEATSVSDSPSPQVQGHKTSRHLWFSQVLAEELEAIDGGPLPESLRNPAGGLNERALFAAVHRRQGRDRLAALCLSGGGIRSATFSLGVMQGLASRGLLDKFHYLSTVSGGGYIGSWLTAWIRRRGEALPPQDPYAQVVAELSARNLQPGAHGSNRAEARPVERLRQYSNYLAPHTGLVSADLWALVAIIVRNIILNWFILIPVLLAALALPRLVARLPELLRVDAGMAAGVLACAWSVGFVSRQRTLKMDVRSTQERILLLGVLPVCAAALLITGAWGRDHLLTLTGQTLSGDLEDAALFGAALMLIGWVGYRASILLSPEHVDPKLLPSAPRYLVGELVIYLQTGLLGGLALRTGALAFDRVPFPPSHAAMLAYAASAPPLFLLAFLLAATIFTGLASKLMSEQDREWWARFGAWLLIVSTVWAAIAVIVLLLPHWLANAYSLAVAGIATLGSGSLTVLAGLSSRSLLTSLSPSGRTVEASKDATVGAPKRSWMAAGIKVALPMFVVLFMVALSLFTDLLVAILMDGEFEFTRAVGAYVGADGQDSGSHLSLALAPENIWVAAGAMLLGWLASRSIGINEFSLHAMYRNRLIRAYLGASRGSDRTPDKFIGFDPNDDFELCHSAPSQRGERRERPLFHVVNMTLNLVAGEELAWQERKAESMTATSLHVGSADLGYRLTREYGGKSREYGGSGHSLTLGTAMAISGAAASPNMGYHSSPTLTFLLTLFNARLGWWLGNPGKAGDETCMDESPKDALSALFSEAFGRTDRNHPYVYVSDGGHFENLGLYEMVRRRCSLIVVVDAGADPLCGFQDLSSAIRKVRSDFGIPIEIPPHDDRFIFSRVAATKDARVALIGSIRYDVADGDVQPGTLVYIKPAFYDQSEPLDVVNYAAAHPEFPHESTADQFFSESQFESYRALGVFAAGQVCQSLPEGDETLAGFVESANKYVAREQVPLASR